jgi:hypothetical protein
MLASERFWRGVWLAAMWHNLLGGIAVLFLTDWAYAREGLPAPEPAINTSHWGLLILVFAYVYYLVSRDLQNSRNLAVIGILGKLASATPDIYYLAFGSGVPRIFWVSVATNYTFILLFVLFLRFLAREKPRRATAEPSDLAYHRTA